MATMAKEPQIHPVFEPVTGTWQYIVADPDTKEAVIIDSVLDYDKEKGTISTTSADQLLKLVSDHAYTISRILETHAHADHLSASRYLQNVLAQQQSRQGRPPVCIGGGIHDVQQRMSGILNIPREDLREAFDHTFDDDETFFVGDMEARVIHLPGHTPDHIGYIVGSNVFVGDSIFNPDVGSARCDFPGGSATQLYDSMKKLLDLPSHYKLYTGHDYPPPTRKALAGDYDTDAVPFTTVETQRKENKHVKSGTQKEEFVKWRSERDSGLSEPKLLHQAMHMNLRGGRLPSASSEGFRFKHVPVNVAQMAES
jgi:glyoxylase-like metal-dependent hydrolase (beta-lactamase superfamily II)